ncbi:MAG: HNH endonuclease [Treponema sp.]|nr:HNH endonuclease [Treponema sp.]
MKTYLLTWNPNISPWDNIDNEIIELQEKDYTDNRWDCNNSNVKPGDLYFIIAVGGSKRKGIFCFGIVEDFLLKQESLINKDRITNRIIGKNYILLNPEKDEIIDLNYLNNHFPNQKWTPQNCGIIIKDEYANILLNNWEEHIGKYKLYKNKINNRIYLDGNPQQKLYTYYERDSKARDKCLQIKGYTCAVCEKKMVDIYGDIGKEYIHVHHIKFLSSIKKEHKIIPENDLEPVCPNCHSMLHKKIGNKYLTIPELKKIVKGNSNFV